MCDSDFRGDCWSYTEDPLLGESVAPEAEADFPPVSPKTTALIVAAKELFPVVDTPLEQTSLHLFLRAHNVTIDRDSLLLFV